MKFATFAVIALLVAATAYAVSPSSLPPEKELQSHGAPQFDRSGGEDIGSAVPITLPFFDTGNTGTFLNDYDEICPYSGSLSPDCVYSFTPAEDMCIDVDLCTSLYDTKVYMYEDVWTPGFPYACNDDHASCVTTFRSWLEGVMVFAGHTYYIVVDGYGSDFGDYILDVFEVDCPTPCTVDCPPDGIDEGEGPCFDGYVDNFNGGCNSLPYVYSVVTPAVGTITYCGLSGNYDANTLRDTDWYELNLTLPATTITACMEPEFNGLVGFVDMSPGCPNITSFYSYLLTTPCEPICITETLPAGPWCIFVGPSEWNYWPCDADYVLTIDGYDPTTAVEDASWGAIKAIYR